MGSWGGDTGKRSLISRSLQWTPGVCPRIAPSQGHERQGLHPSVLLCHWGCLEVPGGGLELPGGRGRHIPGEALRSQERFRCTCVQTPADHPDWPLSLHHFFFSHRLGVWNWNEVEMVTQICQAIFLYPWCKKEGEFGSNAVLSWTSHLRRAMGCPPLLPTLGLCSTQSFQCLPQQGETIRTQWRTAPSLKFYLLPGQGNILKIKKNFFLFALITRTQFRLRVQNTAPAAGGLAGPGPRAKARSTSRCSSFSPRPVCRRCLRGWKLQRCSCWHCCLFPNWHRHVLG